MRGLRILFAAALLLIACSPKSRREWRPDGPEREYLETWAGRIARSLVPSGEGPTLDGEGLQELMARCDSVPGRYVYLYERISDSLQAMTPPQPGCVQPSAEADGAGR